MSRILKKYSYKYEFLKLELEDLQKEFDNYHTEWTDIFGKYFNNIQKEFWRNEETGEIRQDKPEEVVTKPKTPERIKKLYRKVSVKAHPDKGGNVDEFNTVKTYYEDNDYLGLINYATQNDIEVDITEEDSKLLEDSCSAIEGKVNKLQSSLVFSFFKGNSRAKEAVIKQLQIQYKVEINAKDILEKLETT